MKKLSALLLVRNIFVVEISLLVSKRRKGDVFGKKEETESPPSEEGR